MKLDESRIPTHIAFIMDGNGRWATRRGLPRNLGHKAGVDAIQRTIEACLKYNVKYCTFFAFSTENWKRSEKEINAIFKLVREYLDKKANFFEKNQINVKSIGVLDPFPKDLVESLNNIKEKTKNFDKLTVVFALNYGGRDEIVRTVNKLIKEGKTEVSEADIMNNLDSAFMPEPDFVVRTSGEQRLSNFMLFQMAYSELYFPKVFWPSFNEKHFVKAIKNYQQRDRRYGGIKWKKG